MCSKGMNWTGRNSEEQCEITGFGTMEELILIGLWRD